MKNSNQKWIAIMLIASQLTACTEPNGAPGKGIENGGALSNTDVGTAVGVVGGGVLGSTIGRGAGQVAAVIGGALLGGVLGNAVGKSMDQQALASYDQASQRAMQTGHTETWSNGTSHGTVVPHKRYKNDSDQYCREYTQTIYIDGEKHIGHGTACRGEDGIWRIVE